MGEDGGRRGGAIIRQLIQLRSADLQFSDCPPYHFGSLRPYLLGCSDKSKQPLRRLHHDRVDFRLRGATPAHHRDHVPEDVLIAVAAVPGKPHTVTDVMADDDLLHGGRGGR
jgi:hypothetical protein